MTTWMALSKLMAHVTGPSRSTVKSLAQTGKIHARKVNALGEESESGRIWQIDTDDPTVAAWMRHSEQTEASDLEQARQHISELTTECAMWKAKYEEAAQIIEQFGMLDKVQRHAMAPQQQPLPTEDDLRIEAEMYVESCLSDNRRPTVAEFATAYTVSERTVRRRLSAAGIDYRAWRTRV